MQERVEPSVGESVSDQPCEPPSVHVRPEGGTFHALISTCFSTHHLVFAEDTNHTLWTSGDAANQVVGWLNRKMFEETGDEQRSQGWTPLVLDTNGNGRRDEWVEPNQPVDPSKDKRIAAGFYGVAVNPVDGTVWGSALGFPGVIVRIDPGLDPSNTALAEVFELPVEANGYGVRGMDIDRNGGRVGVGLERAPREL